MLRCPACSSENTENSSFCSTCGGSLSSKVDSSSQAPTELRGRAHAEATTNQSSSWPSSSTPLEGRFAAGTMLAERYRIVGILGKGGMGEVYRADDLKLGQPVSLKFLPEKVASDEATLARFHHEVRIARQVSHPNVCRVYDIGEAQGQHYLSMEYVDGEDLRSLIKRIGRLPGDKAIQIARQLCAGLAAAHDKGVLHRDLKPANVMIDGEGRARITDFGLAAIIGDIRGPEVRAGTPAYMAPEQASGKEVSVASDIYSLGLVLFELFTGKPAFRASSLPELVRMQQEESVTSPSSIVDGLDAAVERVILRCLAKSPTERPSSALAVAAALPGGDPVAAALAAGETPSPDMVAAAGTDLGLRPAVGAALLVAILVGLAALVALSPRVYLTNQVPLHKRPEVLAQDARNILANLGHPAEPADSAHGFTVDAAYLDHLEEEDESPTRWDALATGRPGAVVFWYRQSPRSLNPVDHSWASVSPQDPPSRISAMASVRLNTDGGLLGLELIPPERDESTADQGEVDWSVLLASAGLRAADLEPAEPRWNPEAYCDRRAAWIGSYPGNDTIPIRVEAGAYRGKAVYFRMILPWTQPTRMEEEEIATGERVAQFLGLSMFLLVPLVGGLLLARHNLRLGRGDRRGAFRLAAFYLVVHTIVWVFTAKHVPSLLDEVSIFIGALGSSLWQAFLLYVVYIALEPYVRRRWPDALVSWTRVLAGRFRDPLVGRDILVGAAVATSLSVFGTIGFLSPQWLGRAPLRPEVGNLSSFLGVPRLLGNTIDALVHAQIPAMGFLFLFLLLRILLRRQWLAGAVLFALFLTLGVLTDDNPWITAAVLAVSLPLVLFTLTRFGLLALTVMFYFFGLLETSPLTSDVASWYAGPTIFSLAVMVGLVAYGFYQSLAGRPLVSADLFAE